MLFQARARYGGVINGRRIEFRADDVIDLALDDLAPLLRDSPNIIDIHAPLTVAQAEQIKTEQHTADIAAAEAERAADTAVRDWLTRWPNPTCPGPTGREHHDVTPDTLTARPVAAGHVVACPGHIDALQIHGEVPVSPQPVDRTVSVYRVQRRYAANWVEYAPTGALSGHSTPIPILRLDFEPGQRYELRADIAAWVERDSPGTLEKEIT